jgi:hypothetical protein
MGVATGMSPHCCLGNICERHAKPSTVPPAPCGGEKIGANSPGPADFKHFRDLIGAATTFTYGFGAGIGFTRFRQWRRFSQ